MINSRNLLKDYCLKSLGSQFQEINISVENQEFCVQDALDFMYDFNSDFTEKKLIKHQVTLTNISNEYIVFTEDVTAIRRILPITKITFPYNQAFLLNNTLIPGFNSFGEVSAVDYEINRNYLSYLNERFSPSLEHRFNRHTKKLNIYFEWGKDIKEDEYLVIEALVKINPEEFPNLYNDYYLRQYVTSRMKRQWASNLSKFANVQTVGGVYLNVELILEQANKEIEELEKNIKEEFRELLPIIIG